MALQKAYDDDFGVSHSTAYWRVLSWDVTVEGGYSIRVGVYHDAAARSANKLPVKTKNYRIMPGESGELPDLSTMLTNLDGSTGSRASLYAALKDLAELDGATDV